MPITFCECGQELCHPAGDQPKCKCGHFRKQGLNPPTAEVVSSAGQKHFGGPALEVRKGSGKTRERAQIENDDRAEENQMPEL